MSYSTSLYLDKDGKNRKLKIDRLVNKLPDPKASAALKIEKERFVKDTTKLPEFNETVTQLSQYTLAYGTAKDKGSIQLIVNKMNTGDLSYDDMAVLEIVLENNYKHFFSYAPTKYTSEAATVLGVVLAIFAVILRATYDSTSNDALMLFLILVNLIAVVYTLCVWPTKVYVGVADWLQSNSVPKVIQDKLESKISRVMWQIITAVALVIIVWLIVCFFINKLALGNDIISIISLALSILSDKIVEGFTCIFSWNIYHDK